MVAGKYVHDLSSPKHAFLVAPATTERTFIQNVISLCMPLYIVYVCVMGFMQVMCELRKSNNGSLN